MSDKSVGMVIDDSRLQRKLEALDKQIRGAILVRALKAGGVVVLDAARENILAQRLWKTRNLSRSLHQSVIESSDTKAVIGIGTDLEYAAIHEFGGVVTPKHAKYLAIPVNGAMGSPTDRSDLFPVMTASDTLILMDPDGSVQFVLRDSVTIPAQPYLRPAVDENVEAIREAIAGVLKEEIEKAWGKG